MANKSTGVTFKNTGEFRKKVFFYLWNLIYNTNSVSSLSNTHFHCKIISKYVLVFQFQFHHFFNPYKSNPFTISKRPPRNFIIISNHGCNIPSTSSTGWHPSRVAVLDRATGSVGRSTGRHRNHATLARVHPKHQHETPPYVRPMRQCYCKSCSTLSQTNKY